MSEEYETRLEMARKDTGHHYDLIVDEIARVDETSFKVRSGQGVLLVRNRLGVTRNPIKADRLRCFGDGPTEIVRGVALLEGEEISGIYWYETEKESADAAKKFNEEMEDALKKVWTHHQAEAMAKIAALPDPFRQRMERFMKKPGWAERYGLVELFCCIEAIKIADTLKTPEKIEEFYGPSTDVNQKMAEIPNLEWMSHNPTTFMVSCALALAYVENPKMIVEAHGAMCSSVGCHSYGCFAATLPENALYAPN